MSVLTDGFKLASLLAERLEEAQHACDYLDRTRIAATHIDDLTDELYAKFTLQRLEIDVRDIAVLRTQDEMTGLMQPDGEVVAFPRIMQALRLPYTGDRQLWRSVPSHSHRGEVLNMVEVGGSDHLLLHFDATGKDQSQLTVEREALLRNLQQAVDWCNLDVDPWNTSLRVQIKRRLESRLQRIEQARSLDESSDIPIYQAPVDDQIPIPIEPVALRPPPRDTPIASNPAMGQEIYDDVVQTIEQMTRAMERTPTAAKLGEEEIRDLILFVLNANYRGAVAGEVFNGEGKTDILLRWDGANAFIGECKFWTGPSDFSAAVDQMLGYVTWRDTKAALIIFIRDRKPDDVMKKAHSAIRAHTAYNTGSPSAASDLRANYVLRSKHDDERLISVALIGVVIQPAKAKP